MLKWHRGNRDQVMSFAFTHPVLQFESLSRSVRQWPLLTAVCLGNQRVKVVDDRRWPVVLGGNR
jgi:hypothetical protein